MAIEKLINKILGIEQALSAQETNVSMGMPKNGKERDILLVDVSGSMNEKDFYPSRIEAAKNACHTFVDSKYKQSPDDEIALISYSESAKVRNDFVPAGRGMNTLTEKINRLYPENSTNIRDGLKCAGDLMFVRDDSGLEMYGKEHIILLSDGHDTDSDKQSIIEVADKIKMYNCLISCVGIGGKPSDVDENLLKRVASVVDNKIQYWFITDADSLSRTYEQLATGLVVYNPQKVIRL